MNFIITLKIIDGDELVKQTEYDVSLKTYATIQDLLAMTGAKGKENKLGTRSCNSIHIGGNKNGR